MNINSLIDRYLFESSINKKESTYDFDKKVARSIKRCFESLKLSKLNELNRDTIFNMILYYKKDTKKKNSGINQTLDWFISVLNYFEIKNPFGKYKKLPDDTNNFKHFKANEIKMILNYCHNLESDRNNLIYKLAIYLLLDTGLRTNELLNILVKNIDFDECSILVEKTKNGRKRYVYFTNLSKGLLKQVIKLSDSPYLFINLVRKSQLTPRALRYFLDKMKKDLRFDKLHAHQFRKTFAMGLLKNGAGLEIIQKLLGHSDIKMTMIYLDVYDFLVSSEYKKYQPKYI